MCGQKLVDDIRSAVGTEGWVNTRQYLCFFIARIKLGNFLWNIIKNSADGPKGWVSTLLNLWRVIYAYNKLKSSYVW